MKRITAIILVAILCFSCVAFSAETDEPAAVTAPAKDYSDALALLRLTGIVDDSFVLTDSNITRGMFASMLVRTKGMKDYVSGYGNDIFSDVGSDNEYYSEIAAAKDMGLINGYSDGSFRPDNNITLFEAAICLTRVLGYNVKAEGMGGYPAGYQNVIREIDLLEDVPGGLNEPVSVKNVLLLIYNALHTKVMETTGVTSDGAIYEANDNKTLLYNSFGLSYTDGIVNGVDITNLFGKNDLPYYCIYVGDEVFYTETDINYLLGYHIRAYYKYENERTRIKLAIKDKKKNHEFTVNIFDVFSISDGILTTEIDEEGNHSKYYYNKSAPVIYNGANTKADFNTKIYEENGKKLSGTVKLLDNNNDNRADVVFVDAFEDMVVGKTDSEKSYVYDYFNPKRKMYLNTETSEPYVLIYDETGEIVDMDAITAGSSISVYKSKDDAWQTFIKVYISNKTVTGKINSIEDNAGRKFVYIDEKCYVLSDYALENSIGISVGRTADILLNHKGEIARFTYSTEPGDYEWGLLCAVKKTANFESDYIVRIMTISSDFYDTTFADKMKLDGKTINVQSETGAENLISVLRYASSAVSGRIYENGSNDPYCFQMIKYGINKDGEINYIDTILDEDGVVATEKSMKLDNEVYYGAIGGTSAEYTASVNMISQQIIVADNYSVYMYPSEGLENDDTYYEVRSSGYFTNGGKQGGLLWFKDNAEDFTASVFLRKFKPAELVSDMPNFKAHIVTKITEAVNTDGEKRKKWYLYSQGENMEIMVDPDMLSSVSESNKSKTEPVMAKDIAEGDIIYLAENNVTGEAELFAVLYTLKDNKAYPAEGNNAVASAYAIRSTAGGIKLIYHDEAPGGIEANLDSASYRLFNNIKNPGGITYYNTKTKKARQGSYNDITGYLDNAEEYTSNLLVRWYHPTSKIIREMFVYER